MATENIADIRVGIGQDSHAFVKKGNKKLVLGGTEIPNEKGLEANSDGDVILHSLFNALSQAVGEKSLGYYTDPLLKKGIKDSKEFLKVAKKLVGNKGYKVNNVGVMFEGKKPRIDNYVDEMKKVIGKILEIKEEQIGITATSGEDLTSFGKGQGIQVFSIVSLVKK